MGSSLHGFKTNRATWPHKLIISPMPLGLIHLFTRGSRDNSNEILISIQSTTHSEAKEVKGVVRMPSLTPSVRIRRQASTTTVWQHLEGLRSAYQASQFLALYLEKSKPKEEDAGKRLNLAIFRSQDPLCLAHHCTPPQT